MAAYTALRCSHSSPIALAESKLRLGIRGIPRMSAPSFRFDLRDAAQFVQDAIAQTITAIVWVIFTRYSKSAIDCRIATAASATFALLLL